VADTYITEYQPQTRYGSSQALWVKGDGRYNALLRFELPDSLRGQTIVSGMLRLYAYDRDKGWSCSIGAHRLRRAWDPALATWLDATGSQTWSAPGALGPSDSEATPLDEEQLTGVNQWYEFDVTAAVRDWVTNPDSNHGLLMRNSTTPQAVVYYFASSEHHNENWRPQLVVHHSYGSTTVVAAGAPAPVPPQH
jgi:hypothetical protein